MWGWLPGRLILSGPLVGPGRPGGCCPRKAGWLAGALVSCLCGGCWGGVGLSGAGIGDAPAVVGCWGCCGRGGLLWWVPPFVGGGMLSGFWGSAPWLPGLSGAPGCGGSWVGVGGLVVNCIVDASILL